jgi:hypothetical protein
MIDDDEQKPEVPLDPAITEEMIHAWQHPRLGTSNPERMNNPVWEWLIKSKVNAYMAAEKFKMNEGCPDSPRWCFDRFGQSTTELSDGRKVLIAGEHEDFYDPDFYIYNDVVVIDSAGGISIYGYPHSVFPATDFHSATLFDNRIIIIGSLGYPRERKPGTTPVFALDLATFAISPITTIGTPPDWLYNHTATLRSKDGSILITGGKLDSRSTHSSMIENIDSWKLHLADWRWERLTDLRWPRFDFHREGYKSNRLWEMRSALWHRQANWTVELEQDLKRITAHVGKEPNLDLVTDLYRPPISHEQLPKAEDEYNTHRIRAEGITIRYVEESHNVTMTVEGELPEATIQTLANDLLSKLSTLENTPYEVRRY